MLTMPGTQSIQREFASRTPSPHLNEPCHTSKGVMSHVSMSLVTRMNESCRRHTNRRELPPRTPSPRRGALPVSIRLQFGETVRVRGQACAAGPRKCDCSRQRCCFKPAYPGAGTQCVAVCCSVLQCVAVRCSVCCSVCCGVLQCTV